MRADEEVCHNAFALPPRLRYTFHAWLAASAVFSSMGLYATPRRSIASCAAAGDGKKLATSTHTTSQAIRWPSVRQERTDFRDRGPNVGSAPNTSSRTLVSTAVITPRPLCRVTT